MILVIDAGNTKADWALADRGALAGTAATKGISPYFNTPKEITALAEEAAVALGRPNPQAVYYYGTGCQDARKQQIVQRVLQEVFSGSHHVEVLDDLTGAGRALFGHQRGLAIISGTGSNAGIIYQGVVTKKTRSLGYLLGDEGSGSHIGFAFLKALLLDKLPDDIASAFYQKCELKATDLLSHLYSLKKPQTYAASWVPFISGYAKHPVIRSIVSESFDAMVSIMIKPMLEGEPPEIPIGACGGGASVFKEEMELAFDRRGLSLQKIVGSPIHGLVDYHLAQQGHH